MGNYISIVYSKYFESEPIDTEVPEPEPQRQPLCSLHQRELEFYCQVCKTPICQTCTIEDHKEATGKHELIEASKAFNDFKVTADDLMLKANVYEQETQVGISKCIANASELNKRRNGIIKDINNTVEEIVKFARERGKELELKLSDVCETKEEKINSQIDELKSTASDIADKQNDITELFKSDEATALQTCHQAIQELQQKIAVFPKTEPRDDGKVYFSPTKDQILSPIKKRGIGHVSEKPNEKIFEIVSENPMTVTCYQHFHVEIAQKYDCEIDINDLTVSKEKTTPSWKPLTEDTSPITRIVKSQGKYFVEGSSSTDLTLDVMFCKSSIKGSPIKIIVEPAGIVQYIENVGQSTGIMMDDHKGIQDLVMFENGCFLVLCTCKCEIFKFENSGAFISRITLIPRKQNIHRVWKFKNSLTFCVIGTRIVPSSNYRYCENTLRYVQSNIYFLSQDGKVINSISTTGDTILHFPSSIDVNEDLSILYLADKKKDYVAVYKMKTKNFMWKFGSKGDQEGQMKGPSDVAVTKEGNLIVADTDNHRLQLFDNNGKFIKVIIGGGREDGMVIRPSRVDVDNDDNIIVASEGKVQLFDEHGKFIQVIYQINKEEVKNFVFSIASYFPRRLALAEVNSTTIYLINY